ncbi:acyl-CoA dehydrogenase family protein [Ferviditalea candida]|uniref:Acyl-CoA dehydrogenase family protein n=1 Tax=Ferviditalea candida TaxID=3108399 RepID=A0ABU5ZMW9_9BACL|nr:acyl-CoA dehydrogenase family protein [Paenibacillaceae bacterium T2]
MNESNPTPFSTGKFLFEYTNPEAVFIPEDFTDEHRMIMESAAEFMEQEVVPAEARIENHDYGLLVEFIRQAGELGLLGADIPEAYGGLELDKVSSMIIGEAVAKQPSFSITMSGHAGIGSLPIVFFGNDKQKRKYLPGIAAGTQITAYCLTEPSSGTDALSIGTTAKLAEDGQHYVLNGQKQFITNAGFADIFIVYAKIDGKHFSAFIVERDTEGLLLGTEENKMGLRGTSTRSIILEDCRIPTENLLGEAGKGHLIAFNILNFGRLKLAAGSLGLSKEVISISVKYAKERKQFNQPLSSFPLIKNKLADMNILTYALESMVYRTAGLIDQQLQALDPHPQTYVSEMMKAASEYALEASVNKVFASETIQHIADEAVQIHGGYGYTKEYRIEQIYRDVRIFRIFEGTNEINRLLIPKQIIKKVRTPLQIADDFAKLMKEAAALKHPEAPAGTSALDREKHFIMLARKHFQLAIGHAITKYAEEIDSQQEIAAALSEMAILIYAMESIWLRTNRRVDRLGEEKAVHSVQMTQVFCYESMIKIRDLTENVIMNEVPELYTMLSAMNPIRSAAGINTFLLKRSIADRLAEKEKYIV